MVDRGISASLGFEPRALVAHPDAVELRRFRRRLERNGGLPYRGTRRRLQRETALRVVIGVVLLAPFSLVIGSSLFTGTFSTERRIILGLVLLGAVALVGSLMFLPLRSRWREGRPVERWWRLDRFAVDNGLVYEPEILDPVARGTMFGQGKHRRILDLMMTPDARFELGTFAFVGQNGMSVGKDPRYGYLRIRLERPVPHLVLVSVQKRGLQGYSSVGMAFHESQRVRLEGDFDSTFAVYAPDGYGADSRYVLTPDFMARLVDNGAAYDLEFIDDNLFVYSAAGFDVGQPSTWAWALHFADVVGTSAVRRTQRFSDDRSPLPGVVVASRGQRLKVGVPLVAGVLTAGWIVVQVVRVVLDLTVR